MVGARPVAQADGHGSRHGSAACCKQPSIIGMRERQVGRGCVTE
jgi:hypothetical protein